MFLFTAPLATHIVLSEKVIMKITPHSLISLTVQLLLSVPVFAAPLNERETNYLRQKGEIVFVSQPEHAPFEYIHKENLTGMNVELVQWMAADMGFKARFEIAPLEQALNMVQDGKADVVTSLFYSEHRDRTFDFSETIKQSPVSLFVRSDRGDIASISDLEGKKVAIMASGRALEHLQKNNIGCEIKFVAAVKDSIKLVTSGEVDAMIGDELIVQHYLYATGLGDLKIVGDPLFTARLCMAVNEGNEPLLEILNKGIAYAQKSGILYKIHSKWLGAEYSKSSLPAGPVLLIISIVLVAGLLIIGVILYWNRQLSRKVAERTAQYANSEERLRQIFENSPDAVFVIERSGQITTVNARACELLKMKKSALLSKKIHDLVPKEYRDEVESNIQLWFGGKLKQCEGISMTADGEITPTEMTGTLQRIDGKEVLQLHVRDNTVRKEAEEKLRDAMNMSEEARKMAEQSKEMAETASQAKSEFLANMSHEIRTPLNGMVGMAQLLVDTPLTDEQHNCVETIQQSTNGLLRIINHVLDISKIEAGQMDIRKSPVDLRKLCEKINDMFQPQAEQAGLTFKYECLYSVPPYVVGDEGLLEQVLTNLISNALKFTHKGSVSLNVECLPYGEKASEIFFQVIDTGIGMSKEQQETIFEKFTQADSSAKRMYGGTGLGLAISRQLIELMGGKIGVFSALGKGSTFFFNLNMPESTPPKEEQETEGEMPKTQIRPDVKVLLVEDNRVNQKVAIAILKRAGCEVVAVNNGQDAVQQIRKAKYDLILMDCQMPVMDGFEATAKIRSMSKPICDIPIIAITAHAMNDDKQKCIEGGMTDYIPKPVSRQALIDIINKYT